MTSAVAVISAIDASADKRFGPVDGGFESRLCRHGNI